MQYFYENNFTVNYPTWGINGDSEVSIVAVVSVFAVAIMTTAVILN